MAIETAEMVLRSEDHSWNRERWEQLRHDLGLRYEVIDGVLYVSTSPSFFHQWIIGLLNDELRAQLAGSGYLVMFAPLGVFMPGCDPVQPDLFVLRKNQVNLIQDARVHGVPALLVEVLSPSNPKFDLEKKRAAYAKAGVPEYWVFRPATRDVLTCWQPDPELEDFARTALVAKDGELISATLPFRAPVARFFEGSPDTTL